MTGAAPEGRSASAAGEPPRGGPRESGRAKRRRAVVVLVVAAAASGFAVFVLPQIAGAGADWRRVRAGDHAWLTVAVAAEAASYAGYVALLRAVFGRRVRWGQSFLITMAGVAATRLVATAGAGGIALTTWALRRVGLPTHRVARGMVAFLVALYAVYVAAGVAAGLGLGIGVLSGGHQPLLTLLPAAVGSAVVAVALQLARAPAHAAARLAPLERRPRPLRSPLGWLVRIGASAGEGVQFALGLVRRRPATLLAPLAWWGFDMGALAAAFHAFGSAPDAAVLVMAYVLGTLGNLLPLPGGVGGVEGGMIAAFVAFGEPAGLALVAVLAYRLVSFWLPTAVGAPAYLALQRSLGPAAEGDE